ncbi:MAG: helix-turn-helix transcriptional regulator [Gemmatimonadaceae bacterium]
MENRIKPLREARGWSQLDLATAAGTSQQQVARIESGTQSVRLELALALAAALEAELAEVFPDARRPLARVRKRRAGRARSGEPEPATWFLSLRLRGGTAVDVVVPAAVARARRDRLAARAPASPFFVFEAGPVALALNIDHLVHYHELWDGTGPDDWHDERVPVEQVAVFLAEGGAPLLFDSRPRDEARVDASDGAHPRDLLDLLDTAVRPTEFVSFRDADGEEAFFRAGDVALVSVPR